MLAWKSHNGTSTCPSEASGREILVLRTNGNYSPQRLSGDISWGSVNKYIITEPGDHWVRYLSRIPTGTVCIISKTTIIEQPADSNTFNWDQEFSDTIIYWKKVSEENADDTQFAKGLHKYESSKKSKSSHSVSTHILSGTLTGKKEVINYEVEIAGQLGNCGTCTFYGVTMGTKSGGYSFDKSSVTKELADKCLKLAAEQVLGYMKAERYNALVVADGSGSYFKSDRTQVKGFSSRGIIRKMAEIAGDTGHLVEGINTYNKKTSNKLGVWSFTLGKVNTEGMTW